MSYSIVGRKPKLTPSQQADLRYWALLGKGTLADKAQEFGVHYTTLARYLRGNQKRPVR
jgi:hypothetical protein